MPNSIITDLGSTFTGNDFWEFCEERCILVKYVSVALPRASGQVERANDMILDALKKGLFHRDEKYPRRWLKELPPVVWELCTQASRNMGASPYYLVYSSEAILPVDITFQASRAENFDEDTSDRAREIKLDSVEEERLVASMQTMKYLEGLRRYHDQHIHE